MEKYITSKEILCIMLALYMIAVVISIGRRWILGNIAAEAKRMAATQNRLLKHIKLKYENIFRLEKDVHNVEVFVEKHLLEKKYGGISLLRLSYAMNTCRWLALYLGIYAAVYRFFSGASLRDETIMVYGVGSVLMWISLEVMENMFATEYIQKKTVICISDYLDNYLRNQLKAGMKRYAEPVKESRESAKKAAVEGVTRLKGEKREEEEDLTEMKVLQEREWSDNKIIEEVLREFFY